MVNEKCLEDVKNWALAKLSKKSYRSLECIADYRKGGSLSVTVIGKTPEDKVLFIEMDTSPLQSLQTLLLSKLQSIPESQRVYFTLVIQSPDKVKKCEIVTDIEKNESERKEIVRKKEKEYTTDMYGEAMAKLIVETLRKHGKVSRCYNPRDDWHHAIWLDEHDQYVLGEIYMQPEGRAPKKTLPSQQDFVDWFSEQSPQSLYKQGLPWKKCELLEAIRLAPYLNKSVPN